MITQKDYMKLAEARKKAEEDTTPFAVVANDEIHVVGDANKTEPKKHDYVIGFNFPKKWAERFEEKDIVFRGAETITVEMVYPNVTITPRDHIDVITALVELEPFFSKILDNGEVKELDFEDIRDILRYMNKEMRDALFHAVATILKVDESIEAYMDIFDVIMVSARLMVDFPEAINEANQLFEFSAKRARARANL